jgi:hypothetical protein
MTLFATVLKVFDYKLRGIADCLVASYGKGLGAK